MWQKSGKRAEKDRKMRLWFHGIPVEEVYFSGESSGSWDREDVAAGAYRFLGDQALLVIVVHWFLSPLYI